MKLTTDIQPRKDGTVKVTVSGAGYVFKAEDGALVADVPSDEHVAALLESGNFYPVNEADIESGIAVVNEAVDGGDTDTSAKPGKAKKAK